MIVQRPLAVQLVSKGLLDPNRWRRLLDNSSPREVTMDALMIVSDLARMDKGFYEYINRASVLEHMKDFLTHEDPHVRAKTCSALGNMCRHSSYFYNSFARYQIICLLIDRCFDPNKRTRKFACFANEGVIFWLSERKKLCCCGQGVYQVIEDFEGLKVVGRVYIRSRNRGHLKYRQWRDILLWPHDAAAGTPKTKQAIKNLTAQVILLGLRLCLVSNKIV
ncbi:hypothetical protein UlMin_033756 [Ulmus minor]